MHIGALTTPICRALYDKCPSGAIPKPGNDAIVSIDIAILVDIVNQRLGDAERFRDEILAYVQR